MRHSNCKLALTGAVVLSLAGFASADVNWAGATGNWNIASNWESNSVPGSADTAVVENGGTAIVSDAQTVWGVHIGYVAGSDGTVQVDSGGTLTSSGTNYIHMARYAGASATLTVDGGSFVSDSVIISSWSAAGNATITVANGGTITSADSISLGYIGGTGAFTIDGSGSTVSVSEGLNGDVYIGRTGIVTLDITNGGLLTNADDGFVGAKAGALGTITVAGADSAWEVGDILYLGRDGAATLTIEDGGLVRVGGKLHLARDDGGEGTLNVNGGSFVSDGLIISSELGSGSATISVSNGGTITSADSISLGFADGTGAFTIDGSGSTASVTGLNGDVYIGRYGNATLDISNGGLLTNTDDGFVGAKLGGSGTITVAGTGSAWKLGDILYVGRDGAGTLTIENGGLVQAGRLAIDYDVANDDGEVRVGPGGMLAIADGGSAANNIGAFLALLTDGTDNMVYWNGSAWDDIRNATQGTDYALDQYSDGGTSYSRVTFVDAVVIPDEIEDVALTFEDPNAIISWTAIANAIYVLQSKEDLVYDPVWSNVVTGIVGVDGTMSTTSSTTAATSFYRIIVE